MTTNNIKQYLMGFLVSCGTAAALSGLVSCSDWDDHYEDMAKNEAASQSSLWEVMLQHPELSDFREVLSKTEIYRHNKKTGINYAQLLDGSQAFTVMAPVNGQFDKDALLQLVETTQGDSIVESNFVKNQLSNNVVGSTADSTSFFLLNGKKAYIYQGKIIDTPISEGKANIKARGGVLHILDKPLTYRNNLYEAILNLPQFSKAGQQLKSYEKEIFLPSLSIEGDIVDGEQIYIDSVFSKSNILLGATSGMMYEDSTAYMVMCTDNEFQRVWEEAMSFYKYDETVGGADSLQRLYANQSLLSDAYFSTTIQAKPKDSLITYAYNKRYPQYHVFHKPFDEGGIFYGATPIDCSNGTLYQTDKWPFTPQMTYQRELRSEGEYTNLILNSEKDGKYSRSTHMLVADSISENAYMEINPNPASASWNITYKLENTLSGAYDICAIILPYTVLEPEAVDIRPNKFKVALNYVNAKGEEVKQEIKYIDEKDGKEKTKNFTNNPYAVDTVVLAENFVFPTCNYMQENTKVSITLTDVVSKGDLQKKTHTKKLFLDCIYLRPKGMVKPEE